MSHQDDDDIELSTSDSRRYASEGSDRGKQKALEQKLKEQGKELSHMPFQREKSKLKLNVLKQRVNEAQQEKRAKVRERPIAAQTKTHGEEEEVSKIEAKTDPNADQLIQQSQMQEAAEEEQKKEGEIQQEPT